MGNPEGGPGGMDMMSFKLEKMEERPPLPESLAGRTEYPDRISDEQAWDSLVSDMRAFVNDAPDESERREREQDIRDLVAKLIGEGKSQEEVVIEQDSLIAQLRERGDE